MIPLCAIEIEKDSINQVTIDEQLAYLTKGAEETIRVEELKAKLGAALKRESPCTSKWDLIPRRRTFIWATRW